MRLSGVVLENRYFRPISRFILELIHDRAIVTIKRQ